MPPNPFTPAVIMYGTTSGSANTQSLSVNPLNRSDVWVEIISGDAYVYDDNSTTRKPSGVLKATIDIRSGQTSMAFKAALYIVADRLVTHAEVKA